MREIGDWAKGGQHRFGKWCLWPGLFTHTGAGMVFLHSGNKYWWEPGALGPYQYSYPKIFGEALLGRVSLEAFGEGPTRG